MNCGLMTTITISRDTAKQLEKLAKENTVTIEDVISQALAILETDRQTMKPQDYRAPHCPLCGFGSNTTRSRVCLECIETYGAKDDE